ncbi:uncharacterized protein LOC114355244 isoform X1 [Ostrinia furnacalis]|uniref:uncharacterized protein LOC114355244 isoform X1 n=1 Tax=Ostrinia furnacalis TaxID=93504 RepID=UPI00103AD83F|nr:uncharacterized protein LOC114355244 isoform X1 [Ostrinia furnacalis]
MDINSRAQGVGSWNWPLLLSVVLLNICLPSLVLSYGVFLVHSTELGIPLWLGLSTPAIFVLTYGLTQCWCRDAADTWGGPVGYRVIATVGLMLVVASLILCVFVPYYFQPCVYGVLGGFGSSLISAQVDAVIFDTYDTNLSIIRGICFAGQAIGQSLFPHILSALIETYEYSYSYMVLAGIILQTLPGIMLLKVSERTKRPLSFSRYSDKTYAIFNNEGMNGYVNELQLHDLSTKSWQSPSDDNLHRDENGGELEYDNEANVTITPPPSPEEKRRNIFGVEILPEIPEESEDSEDEFDDDVNEIDTDKSNKKRFSLAIKRLSTIGDSFDEYIVKQIRRDSVQTEYDGSDNNKEYSEIEVTYDTISPVTDIQREKIFNSFSFRCQSAYASMRRRMRMPSYRVYRLRRRLVYVMYSINDTFIKPLSRSLSCWRFYPALMMCFCKLSLSAVSLVLMPLIATQVKPKISMTETNFLISLHGFTWICFLLCTPWLAQTPKRNFKYVAVFGLIISTGASFVLAEANNHDYYSIGCVVAGIGYGAITSCWETSVQDFVGARKWPKFHSTLETLSSTILTLFVVGLCFIVEQEGGLQRSMFVLGVILAAITFVWCIIAAVAIYVTKVRSLIRGR